MPVDVAAVAVHQGASPAGVVLAEGLTAMVVFPLLARAERSAALRAATVVGAIAAAGGLGGVANVPPALTLAGAAVVAQLVTVRPRDRDHGEYPVREPGLASSDDGRPLRPSDIAIGTLAVVAGYLPGVDLALRAVGVRHDVLATVGLDLTPGADLGRFAPLVGGLVAAFILGVVAHRRRQLGLVAAGAGSAVLGAAASAAHLPGGGPGNAVVAVALGLLGAELIALVADRDEFWARPARWLAGAAEVVAGLVAAVGALTAAVVLTGLVGRTRGRELVSALDGLAFGGVTFGTRIGSAAAIAGIVGVAGWLVADQRRRVPDRTPAGVALLVGGGWEPTAPVVALTAVTAVLWATWSGPAVAVAAMLLTVLAVLSGRPLAHGTAAVVAVVGAGATGLRWWGPPWVRDLAPLGPPELKEVALFLIVSATGAIALAAAAVLHQRTGRPGTDGEAAIRAVVALFPIAVGGAVALDAGLAVGPVALVAALLAWSTGVAIDLCLDGDHRRSPSTPVDGLLPMIGRVASLAALGVAMVDGNAAVAAVATALTIVAVADAVLRRRPVALHLLTVTLPVAVALGGQLGGWTIGQSGVAVTVAAVLVAPLALREPRTWQGPGLAVSLACLLTGLALATQRSDTFGTALLLTAALAAAAGLDPRRRAALVGAGALATTGTWLHLGHADVHALDAYAAPVALVLVGLGWAARRSHPDPTGGTSQPGPAGSTPGDPATRGSVVSSWIAYGPAIVALGGTALIERFDGGADVHALVAGLVGLVAVLAGGARRLAGPLLLGTAVLLAASWHELVGATVGVPTWAWLAAGGAVLVASGLVLERHDTGPVETGRRLVDTIADRYT